MSKSGFLASLTVLGAAIVAAVAPVHAQNAPAPLEEIDVIGTTPIGGDNLDRDKVPSDTTTISSGDFAKSQSSSILGALNKRVPGVNVSDSQGNQYFADLFFHGYTASPLNGAPQGVAVYQNGVRINEAYGDTTNWDLVPTIAIDQADIWTNNPAFGLNALGGAFSLKMKSGFTFQGFEAEMKAGRFGLYEGNAQYGAQFGPWAVYLAGEGVQDRVWRDFSKTHLAKVYGDIGYKSDQSEFHLNVTAADTKLGVVAPTPVDLLERRGYNSVYTGPQVTNNTLGMVNLQGKVDVTDHWSLQGNAYYRRFKQTHIDGNDTDVRPCEAETGFLGFLCLDADDFPDDTPQSQLVVRNSATGELVPANVVPPGTLGSIDRTFTKSTTAGGSLQATNISELFGHTNHFVVGAAFDHGAVDFRSNSELGSIPPDIQVIGTGIFYYVPAPGGIEPVDLKTRNNDIGLYVSDTFDLTDRLSLTAGGRFNHAEVKLMDQLGTDLNGQHSFSRFNPGAGLTYKITPDVTFYGGYSEANRAPTALELSCADPDRTCLLEASLVADPPLKQVVSRTWEAGLRGKFDPAAGGRINWKVGFYNADNTNDILNVPATIAGRSYYVNGGKTRRRGVDLAADYTTERWALYGTYSYIDATFRKDVTLASPNSPTANDDGEIDVQRGDHLPTIPAHQLKIGVEYLVTPKFTFGGDMIYNSSQWFVGDESNDNKKLPGFAVFNLHANYQFNPQVRLFGGVNNVFNKKYATFGTYVDPTDIGFLNLEDPRTVTPAQPISAFVGVGYKFSANAAPVLGSRD